jgi:ferrous iron transport protein A
MSHAERRTSPCRLSDLAPGERATVTGFEGDVPARVFEMGLLPGTVVEVVRTAPLGDPLELRVRGFYLSLRRDEAAGVVVEQAA